MAVRFMIAVIVSLMAYAKVPPSVIATDAIATVSDLERQLAEEMKGETSRKTTFDVFSWADLKTLSVTKRIESAGLPLWRELIHQGHPSLKLIAYHCIDEHSKRFRTEAALSFVFLTDTTSQIVERTEPGRYVRSLKVSQDSLDAFSMTMNREFSKDQRLWIGFAVSELSDGFLMAWIRHDKPVLVPLTNEAIVANRLLTHNTSRSESDRNELEKRLRVYASVPGFPRVVYLIHSSDSESTAPALKSTFIDNSVSDLEFEVAFTPHAQLVRTLVPELAAVKGDTAERRLTQLRRRLLK